MHQTGASFSHWIASACLLPSCMIELSKGVCELHYRVRLNAGFHSNLKWWGCFLPIWNGLCPMASLGCQVPQATLLQDRVDVGLSRLVASGSSWSGLTTRMGSYHPPPATPDQGSLGCQYSRPRLYHALGCMLFGLLCLSEGG